MVEQVAYRDRASAGDDAGEPPLDRVVQPKAPVLDQRQHQGGDERLRDAADPEAEVRRHRRPSSRGATCHALDVVARSHDDERARGAGVDDPLERRGEVPGLIVLRGEQDDRCRHHDRDGDHCHAERVATTPHVSDGGRRVRVVVRPGVLDRFAGGVELGLGDHPVLEERPLQGDEPALVIPVSLSGRVAARLPRPDLGDQPRAEDLEVDDTGIVERDRKTERTALPRLGEHELAVRPGGRRGRARVGDGRFGAAAHAAGVSARPAPIMLSRVTSAARSSSLIRSVPSGRSGTTR